jgi:hypothetical protein
MKPVSGAQANLLSNYSHIIINLGATQKGNLAKAVVLTPNSKRYISTGGSLALEVSVSGRNDASQAVELTIQMIWSMSHLFFPFLIPTRPGWPSGCITLALSTQEGESSKEAA